MNRYISIQSILTKSLIVLSLAIVFFLLTTEPSMALNIEKIGKGVTGDHRKKMMVIKEIVFYAGIFFTVLGAIVYIYRKKKFDLQKRSDTSEAAGPFLMVVGLMMMSVKLWG